MGQNCTRGRLCGIDGCQGSHNRLLHRNDYPTNHTNKANKTAQARREIVTPVQETPLQQERQQEVTEGENLRSFTMVTRKSGKKSEYVSLRTIPVVLKNGNVKLFVNALLDDASTKSYINDDVAAELGLHGELQQFTVSALNELVT